MFQLPQNSDHLLCRELHKISHCSLDTLLSQVFTPCHLPFSLSISALPAFSFPLITCLFPPSPSRFPSAFTEEQWTPTDPIQTLITSYRPFCHSRHAHDLNLQTHKYKFTNTQIYFPSLLPTFSLSYMYVYKINSQNLEASWVRFRSKKFGLSPIYQPL